jgi:CheY-like chemotaxis protein
LLGLVDARQSKLIGGHDHAEAAPVQIPIPILVVEDQLLVRIGIVATLEDAGFDAVEAGTAAEAITVLVNRPDIRIVFTDIEMPGTMDGLALSHYVRRRWPPTLIVVSSGRKRPTAAEMPVDTVFISKPHSQSELAGVMRDVKVKFARIESAHTA